MEAGGLKKTNMPLCTVKVNLFSRFISGFHPVTIFWEGGVGQVSEHMCSIYS